MAFSWFLILLFFFLVAECEPVGKQVFKKPKNQFIRPDVNSTCDEG